MSAFAAVRGLFSIPRAGPHFRQRGVGQRSVAQAQPDWDARAETFKNILSQGGRTITQLSAATRRRYGAQTPYFIPASFLYKLRSGVTPHICQVAALSHITGYRFHDWLRVCGFDLREIPRLQMRLHSKRTVLITPEENCFDSFVPHSAPGYGAVWNSSARFRPGEESGRRRYLFAKIGTDDAAGCTGLLPGGIVRVDRHYTHPSRGDRASMSNLLWLVEQPNGLTCSQVEWIDDRQIVLLPSRPPWGCWPLRLPTEARILGSVDVGHRPLESVRLQPGAGPLNLESPFLLPPREEHMKFSDLLRRSRRRSGLTFRAAHRLTRAIAQILGNREYAVALGLLSDYEAMSRLPRHIAKILSLCVIYCMDVRELMEAAGVYIDDSAKLPLSLLDGRLELSPDLLDHPAQHSGAVRAYAQSASS